MKLMIVGIVILSGTHSYGMKNTVALPCNKKISVTNYNLFGSRSNNPTPTAFNLHNPFDCLSVLSKVTPDKLDELRLTKESRKKVEAAEKTLQRFFTANKANDPIYEMIDANTDNAKKVNPQEVKSLISKYPIHTALIMQNLGNPQ